MMKRQAAYTCIAAQTCILSGKGITAKNRHYSLRDRVCAQRRTLAFSLIASELRQHCKAIAMIKVVASHGCKQQEEEQQQQQRK